MRINFTAAAVVLYAVLLTGPALSAQDVHPDVPAGGARAYGSAAKGVWESSGTASLVREGDELRLKYMFDEAVEKYSEALDAETDSLVRLEIEEKLLVAENGRNMSDFVVNPKVVSRHRFSLEDFFLYYPLQDGSWRLTPNQLDEIMGHPLSHAAYIPESTSGIYFSALDAAGSRNIYRTEYRDSVWSRPALISEDMTTSADEIYPMISPDGKTLYFASSGLYGVGGYDLYMSRWDEAKGEWGVPENMGFPYSSPYDDFLFVNTPDGKYSMFASNRACPADSVDVYVLDFESNPVHRRMSGAEELRELCALTPADGVPVSGIQGRDNSIPESVDTQRYMHKVAEVRELRDSLFICMSRVDEYRSAFAEEADERQRDALLESILSYESLIPQVQAAVSKATGELQKIEMEFLFNGVVIDPDKLEAEADREVVGSDGFAFSRMNPGGELNLRFAKPGPEFDYSFAVLPEGRLVEDGVLPDGLIYQIEIFTSQHKVSVEQLNGLSPVFESRDAGGRYVYRAGLFRTYYDVLENLNVVKKAGFRGAVVVPLWDGEVITHQKARELEAAVRAVAAEVARALQASGSDPVPAPEGQNFVLEE